jgi:hypothetical protein
MLWSRTASVINPAVLRRRVPDAAAFADQLASLARGGVVVALPTRDASWVPRDRPREASLTALAELERRARAAVPPPGVHLVLEGLCRVMLGADKAGRGGERMTCGVFHVVADGEPVRTIILPVE